MINEFRGKYYFLSNFYSAFVEYEGIVYLNNESAFQSAKVTDYNTRLKFANLDPSSAKRKGRHIQLRHGWDDIKFDIMHEICKAKFTQNLALKSKLLATENEYLEEGNTWGDRIWGTVNGKGQNNLGKILMRIREELK
ncbi:NADAR family protein [Anaerovorax sp. IOR16]|uniref:NADAR family protein n=1 Tax=Anaerovorax sp. IOR16 TaxID=2773458 RepID=UPI0019D22867